MSNLSTEQRLRIYDNALGYYANWSNYSMDGTPREFDQRGINYHGLSKDFIVGGAVAIAAKQILTGERDYAVNNNGALCFRSAEKSLSVAREVNTIIEPLERLHTTEINDKDLKRWAERISSMLTKYGVFVGVKVFLSSAGNVEVLYDDVYRKFLTE